jgi:hypothetical protein
MQVSKIWRTLARCSVDATTVPIFAERARRSPLPARGADSLVKLRRRKL